MRIAHFADLHLGYRAYHRVAPGGVNLRERDVADALARIVDQVVAAAPDLVLVAGDVFHSSRPSNAAIMDAFREFRRLRDGLPVAPVVVVAGDHDSPRPGTTGSILRLLSEIPDVHVADDGARTIRLEALDASVLCLPHAALVAAERPAIEPDPAVGTNILLLHGAVTGTEVDGRPLRMIERGGGEVERSELREELWDYVALGHCHQATRLAPRVWYAGAIERTTTDIWAEASSPKGWVLFDTEAGEGEFREVPTREVVDLPSFSARRRPDESAGPGRSGEPAGGEEWLTPAEVDERIAAAVAGLPGGVAGKIVRLVIMDLPRDLFRQLDHERIRALKADAVHFQLDARRPEGRPEAAGEEERRLLTLEQELERFLADWRTTAPGIELSRLLVLGSEYLAETDDS